MSLKKIYIKEGLAHVPYFVLFKSLSKSAASSKSLFQTVNIKNLENIVTIVLNPADSDFIVVPYNYFSIQNNKYLEQVIELSRICKKKIIIFAYGDSDQEIFVPDSIIFRTSQYRYKLKENEIIMPAIAEDLSQGLQVAPREKKEVAVVGFVGWAGFRSCIYFLKYVCKVLFVDLRAIVLHNSLLNVHKSGLYFRRKALKVLKSSSLVKPNIIVRTAYSAHKETLRLPADQVRKEYIENMRDSDFILAPKGDGNYSLRFYEALSLGRIPVLVDTDCVLPFENLINYDEFIVRINYKNIIQIDQIIAHIYKSLSAETFNTMQQKAQSVFKEYLSVETFFRKTFDQLK